MASTLDGGGKDRNLGRGHGTGALGPSDRSDTGSDVQGGPGTFEGDTIGLDEPGTTSDAKIGGRTAGPDMGDSDLDSDTDSTGTGERRAAGRDQPQPGDRDRDTDQLRQWPDSGERPEGSASTSGTRMPSGGGSSGLASDEGVRARRKAGARRRVRAQGPTALPSDRRWTRRCTSFRCCCRSPTTTDALFLAARTSACATSSRRVTAASRFFCARLPKDCGRKMRDA